MKENLITIARIKRPEPKTFTIRQPGTIPPRPKWMVGELGFIQRIFRTCPKCGSMGIWRGPWCHFTEAYYVLVRLEPPVKHSGRKRNCACEDCGEFWNDVQAIPYKNQDWDDGI